TYRNSLCECLVPGVARSGYQMPKNKSYRELPATGWVLGTVLSPLEEEQVFLT
ncbi:hypothetical protein STEG23_032681, partial [Scotinomys teguina]